VHGHHAFLLLSCAGSHTMVLDARGPRLEEVTADVSTLHLLCGVKEYQGHIDVGCASPPHPR
jgi:hypothetical protein